MNPLNSNARPYTTIRERALQDERSLFITFSSGSRLTWREISKHFTRYYGNVVERVYVHQPDPNKDPEFGKIVFKMNYFPRMIMGNNEVVRVKIRGKDAWLKHYVPQHHRNINN